MFSVGGGVCLTSNSRISAHGMIVALGNSVLKS